MFKKNFINYCNIKGVAPNKVCADIGLSNSIYSNWTDESVPRRATLMKLADYFDISVEDLLSDEPPQIEKPTANSSEPNADLKLIAALVAQLDERQLPLVLSMAQDIPKLSYDQLRSIAEVIKNMVK